jgi:hypothetical protein
LGTDQGQRFLYVLNDNDEVVYRRVKVGTLTEGRRVIEDGLKPGERVVVNGLQRVRPGDKVVAKPTNSASTPITPNAGLAMDAVAARPQTTARPVVATDDGVAPRPTSTATSRRRER